MADDHITTTTATVVVPRIVEQIYTHRILQQGYSTPENDRVTGFLSLGLIAGVILLSLSMFLCNALVLKFWYVLY